MAMDRGESAVLGVALTLLFVGILFITSLFSSCETSMTEIEATKI